MPSEFAGRGNHQRGAISEATLALHMIQKDFTVYVPAFRAPSPIDLICIHNDTQDVVYLDSKSDKQRIVKGRANPSRIHRVRTQAQKKLGVYIAYVTRRGAISFSPKLPKHLKDLMDVDF